MAEKKVTRQLSIFINDREVVNSLGGIGREIGKVNGEMKNLNKSSETYDEDLKALQKDLTILKQKQSEFKDEIYETNLTASESKEIFSKLFLGFTTGNLELAREGLRGLKDGVQGVVKSALAFIATPIGATIAILAGIAGATKLWFDYNKAIAETIKLTEQLTGFSGKELQDYRASVQATANVFDKEFNEVLKTANSLSKQYKITQQEALDLINQGFTRGADANGDFLEKLQEYPIQFKNAGFSAQEFIDIATQEAKGGIYNDKLVDALKEADLALKEMTKTQRDALTNAFGQTFADEIAVGVKSGEITTKDAIFRIIKEADKLKLNYQQQQQLVADVFKGAGEDAGGFAEIILQLNEAFDEENKILNENEQATQRLVTANEEYEQALADLFDASQSGFPEMLTNLKSIASEIGTNILVGLKNMFTSIEQLKQQAGLEGTSDAIKDVANNIEKFGGTVEDETKYMVDASTKNIDRLKNEIEKSSGIFDDPFGFSGKKAALQEQLAKEEAYLEELKKIAQGKSDAFVNYQKSLETPELADLNTNKSQEEIDAEKKKQAELKKISDAARKDREKADKEEKDKYKALQDSKIELAKAELDFFIATNKAKIDKNGELTTELVAQEIARQQAILDKQLAFNEEEKLRKLAEIEEKAKSEEELNNLKSALNLDYETKKQELELGFQQQTDALKKEYENEQAALKAEQLLIDKEIELAEAEGEFERQRIEEQQRYDTQLADYKKQLEDKKITKEQYDKLIEIASKQHSDNEAKIARAEKQAKIAEYGELFGQIAQLLGENTAAGKAAALASVAISQGLAVARIWEQESTLPSPFDVIAKVTGTAIAVGNVIAAAKQINKVKPPKFFYGGPTGDKAALGKDEHGAITGYVHKNEYVIPEVMTQDPRFADTISWLEANRQQRLRPFAEGGATSEGLINSNANAKQGIDSTSMLVGAVNQLNAILASGIIAKAYIGYEEAQGIDELNQERNDSTNNGTLAS